MRVNVNIKENIFIKHRTLKFLKLEQNFHIVRNELRATSFLSKNMHTD